MSVTTGIESRFFNVIIYNLATFVVYVCSH